MHNIDVFYVTVPGDLTNTMGGLAEQAIVEASEAADTYRMPATWSTRHMSGEVGDHEVGFAVMRFARGESPNFDAAYELFYGLGGHGGPH